MVSIADKRGSGDGSRCQLDWERADIIAETVDDIETGLGCEEILQFTIVEEVDLRDWADEMPVDGALPEEHAIGADETHIARGVLDDALG